jgi:hypothetical protein
MHNAVAFDASYRRVSRYAVTLIGEPLGGGRVEGCEHGARGRLRPKPERSRRPGRAGLTPLVGRDAAPDTSCAKRLTWIDSYTTHWPQRGPDVLKRASA